MPLSRPTLAQILKRAKADLDDALDSQRSRIRYTVENVLATVVAGLSHTLHGHIDSTSKRVLPSPLDLTMTKLWGGMFGVSQNPAAAATGSLIITGTATTPVPAGTEWQREDGELYTTDEAATIDANGSVTVTLTASEGGTSGNAESGTTLSLTSAIVGVDTDATVATDGISGGLGVESARAYYDRVIAEVRRRPRGGGPGDYIAWAKEVDGITQAWEVSPWVSAGNVGVIIATDTPDSEAYATPSVPKMVEVQEYLDTKVPIATSATAVRVTTSELDVTISNLVPDTLEVRNAITAELRRMLREEANAEGFTLALSKIDEAISVAPGESSHTLDSPTVDQPYAAGTIPVLGDVTWA